MPGGLGAQFVAENEPSRHVRPTDEHLRSVFRRRRQFGTVRGQEPAHEVATAQGIFAVIESRAQPLAGDGFKTVRFAQRQTRLLAHALDGARERMVRKPREVERHPAHVVLRAHERLDADELQVARRQRARLVQRDNVHLRQRFQCRPAPEQSTPRRAPNAMADRIADGMLNTSAHGDATTSSVIAR